MPMKLSDQPHDLSYYTTWWLTPEPSISPQTTTLSDSDDNILVNEHGKKQKTTINEITLTCCIPMKTCRSK